MSGDALFSVAPEVREALEAGRPVLALETTLVTHGLPAPEGLATAAELEAAVRAEGAVPATIGVLGGRIRAGLTAGELDELARSAAAKLSLGNLASGLAARQPGSTTVAATVFAAHSLGIRVFATGGIGGVHRRAAETGDVSADLAALARFPVAVVSSGAKAVLDLRRTVEALETLGVPVLGWRTDRFPAFYRRDSGLRLDRRFDALADLAGAVATHLALGLGTGLVIANPVPPEHEMEEPLYEASLGRAVEEARAAGVSGRDVTPFLLERLRELTAGRSVFSNRALLLDNARVGARLALALAALHGQGARP